MDKVGFQDYLINVRGIKSYKSYIRTAEMLEGYFGDLDIVSLTSTNFDNAIKKLYSMGFSKKYTANYKTTLNRYYEFKNNSISKSKKPHNRIIMEPYDITSITIEEFVEYNLPFNNYPTHSINVAYDSNVPEENKLPGLEDFVRLEANFIKKSSPVSSFDYIRDLIDKKITIILDDSCPTDIYGEYTEDEICSKIRKMLLKYEPIKPHTLLMEIRNVVTFDKASIAINKIKNILSSISYDDIQLKYPLSNVIKKIRELLYQGKMVCRRLGEYNIDCIRIYYRNINPNGNFLEYLANIRKVLAHEIYHFAHNHYDRGTFNNESREAKIVIESLADFFAFIYLLDDPCIWRGKDSHENINVYSISVAEQLYDSWEEHYGTIWPYANAILFTKTMTPGKEDIGFVNNSHPYKRYGSLDKHYEVFERSLSDMVAAYQLEQQMVP